MRMTMHDTNVLSYFQVQISYMTEAEYYKQKASKFSNNN